MTAMPKPMPSAGLINEFHNGDRMSQREFHRIYGQMPEHVNAELIGGIVYMASPLKLPHGNRHLLLGAAFAFFEGNTEGVEASDNATVILGEDWVFLVRENQVRRFDLRSGQEVKIGDDGVLRSLTFPGFWIDLPALSGKDHKRFMTTLQQGLATPEHTAFVERLARAKTQS
jgi:hypothetical protein